MDSVPHKTCSRCAQVKPLDQFAKGPRYRDDHQSYCRECMRAYRAAIFDTPEKIRAERDRTRNYYRTHNAARERNRAAGRIADVWRWHNDPEYRQRKNEQAAIKNQRRRKYAAERGSYTYREWRDLCARYGFCCLKCGVHTRKLSPDHIVPLSRGGSNTIDNIQPLCWPCNLRKGAKIADYRTLVQLRMEWED